MILEKYTFFSSITVLHLKLKVEVFFFCLLDRNLEICQYAVRAIYAKIYLYFFQTDNTEKIDIKGKFL